MQTTKIKNLSIVEMALKMFAALIALGIPLMVQAYSAGAPSAECSTMMPRHHVDAQKGAAPYDVILAKNKIRSGETVKVTIKGKKNDQTFKGLIVQARVGNTPIGAFDVSPSNQYIQLLDCGSSRGVSLCNQQLFEPRQKVSNVCPAELIFAVDFLHVE